MSQYDLKFDLKIMLFTVTYISWSSNFALYPEKTPYFLIMSQYDLKFDLKTNVGHSDLYFMVLFWILPYILKLIWCINIVLLDYDVIQSLT